MTQRTYIKFKDGKKYRLCVAKIESKNILGQPRLLRLVDESEMIGLKGGEEFATIFVSDAYFEKTTLDGNTL
jgi:hypothetical protein